MVDARSRLVPQLRFWDEDLPLRESPVGGEAFLYDDALKLDSATLVMSRASNMLRGVGLLFAGIFLVLGLAGIYGLTSVVIDLIEKERFDELGFAVPLLLFVVASVVFVVCLLGRLDIATPVDSPIVFDRRAGHLKAYEAGHVWWNPFGKWPTVIKEFDWSDVQAEIHKQAGFNGRAYIVRYALVLCVCKPGTFEVVDRITLKGNRILTEDLKCIWNYLRRYMAEGPDGLPKVEPRPRDASLRRSFFEYMRWWDPTAEGRVLRTAMPGWLLVFNSVVTFLMFPLFAGMGLGHYVAMRMAPAPDWENTPVMRVGLPVR